MANTAINDTVFDSTSINKKLISLHKLHFVEFLIFKLVKSVFHNTKLLIFSWTAFVSALYCRCMQQYTVTIEQISMPVTSTVSP